MQWVFLVLALLAALVELHTGTFYLAGVAAAALLTTVIGFWVRGDLLIIVFALLCATLLSAVLLFRRRRADTKALPDFDVGQSVSVQTAPRHNNRLLVLYRGTSWEAVMDDGAVVAPGDTPIIASRSDKLLHLVLPPKVAQT
jgi:membrane protein implicated in regulation of membrane protease activity